MLEKTKNCTFWQTDHNDFSVRFWGSKWNSYGYDYLPKKDDALVFNTAWSAVPQVIAKLSETYPEVTVDYCWADEDFGSNTGRLQFKNGEVIDGYIPADQSPEAYEFAAAVQDSTLEDFGYVLDKDTGKVRYMEEVTPQEAQKHSEKAKGAER